MKKHTGMYNKFEVGRTDGRDKNPTDIHYQCDYFVLDMSHDRHAMPALIAYAKSIAGEKPMLAADLLGFVADSRLFYKGVEE
jgi:hypothetical protein